MIMKKNEVNHNKIITQAARIILKPNGLFQKASSRTWIDDNGWYLIVVEFQPSGFEKGTYLNVGINYLWRMQEYLTFNYGYRVHECVSFKGDEEKFFNKITNLAELAMEKVMEYRKFRNIETAQRNILKAKNISSTSHELYNNMMICGLCENAKAEKYFKKLFKITHNSDKEYEKEYYNELVNSIAPVINISSAFKEYIIEKINLQRKFWHSKSSMKKLSEEFQM